MKTLLSLLCSLLCSLLLTPSALAQATAPRRAHFHRPSPQDARHPPHRIVSLAPVLTETLFALGVGERVVGVTRFCDRPPQAKAIPKVGGFVDPSLEAIVRLKPDLVVAMPSRGQRKTLDALRSASIPVFVAFGDTIDEIRDLITGLGQAVGREAAAQQLRAKLDAELAAVPKVPGPPPRVAILVATDPLVLAGPTTFAADAISRVGGRPVVKPHSTAWPTWSLEALARSSPDLIVVAEGPEVARRFRARLQTLGLGALAKKVRAGPHALFMRPGPHLADDVMALASLAAKAP